MAPATGTATLSSRHQRLLPRPQPRPPRPTPAPPAPPPPAAEHCIIYARNNSRRTFNANICIQFCTTQIVILSTLREQHQWERIDEDQHPHLITRWTGTNSADDDVPLTGSVHCSRIQAVTKSLSNRLLYSTQKWMVVHPVVVMVVTVCVVIPSWVCYYYCFLLLLVFRQFPEHDPVWLGGWRVTANPDVLLFSVCRRLCVLSVVTK